MKKILAYCWIAIEVLVVLAVVATLVDSLLYCLHVDFDHTVLILWDFVNAIVVCIACCGLMYLAYLIGCLCAWAHKTIKNEPPSTPIDAIQVGTDVKVQPPLETWELS